MSDLRHCVVALSTTGEFIQHIDLSTIKTGRKVAYKDWRVWTDDWEEATSLAGVLNDNLRERSQPVWLHPNERRNVPSKRVGGFEVVSEQKESS